MRRSNEAGDKATWQGKSEKVSAGKSRGDFDDGRIVHTANTMGEGGKPRTSTT